jgi:hypothetical protein
MNIAKNLEQKIAEKAKKIEISDSWSDCLSANEAMIFFFEDQPAPLSQAEYGFICVLCDLLFNMICSISLPTRRGLNFSALRVRRRPV